jgi:hypothetical protein
VNDDHLCEALTSCGSSPDENKSTATHIQVVLDDAKISSPLKEESKRRRKKTIKSKFLSFTCCK